MSRKSKFQSTVASMQNDSEATNAIPAEQLGTVATVEGSGVHCPVVTPSPKAALTVTGDEGEIATSLDLDTQAGKAMAFNALGAPSMELGEDHTITIDAMHYLVHATTHTDEETGEVKQVLRAVFIDANGGTFATFSEVVIDRLAKLLNLFDGQRWEGALRLRIVERRARRSGRLMHDLVIVPSTDGA